ncbi:MAG: bifunctional hexulose-6-phosphate synthase/ribonuclease regulator [ANME-2 cluster archaeon]|nr:bifunctional hexulose-6-phosphate synthase/ribonuclease regulator [ANME-2 cluster archaeon]MBC2701256.1 bifunctional hexulose-6-phosphate synthase/ribonuclease regulator [ANME-2 cluster archaeon]MBC2708645.1 bifunctional hexulose-6-phosphate synthase/ribonuclease regulator [ANME-2 cluster archaeon]MBC2748643.1 bifunctional hexulose-6-phosphate synthase/ribonuclease regulator [ANME-2 cluster archaeon]
MNYEHPILQVALDILELDRAIQIAREAVEGGVDWIETGTPLIKSEGMNAVRALKDNFPGHTILADMKTMDTGALEVEMAVKSGADIVILLGSADDSTIADAKRAADKYGAKLMCDLISVPDPVARARELEDMGMDIINIHVGIDMQMMGITPIELLRQMKNEIHIPIAVACGLDANSSGEAVLAGADIVIVGGNIVRSPDVTASARNIRQNMDAPMPAAEDRGSIEAETRQLLTRVSTPNISDAMHRKGAMHGLFSLNPGHKMVGPAVTVQTFEGDWAKTVEAIDTAQPGDVIVIYNGGSDQVAPWGELATLSCINKGVSGVVIDGAVRDIDDIRKLEFPVYARAVVPNAGEPKGFGEINAEISCAGQTVRPGDYIVGDDNGIVVVPKERAYEIARRSVEVEKNESRIRDEITRGSTLSKILRLEKWEKR